MPNLEHIHASLSNERWGGDEQLCRDGILHILDNVRNSTLWATWVWNSMDEAPTGLLYGARHHLGNYDQCLRSPWLRARPRLRTQYCLAELDMNPQGAKTIIMLADPYAKAEDYYLHTETPLGRSFSYLSLGVCVPASCSRRSAARLARALLRTGFLPRDKMAAVTVRRCHRDGAPAEYSTGYFIFMYSVAALLLVAVCSTYYVSEYPTTAASCSFVNHVARSFCLRRNWGSLMRSDAGAEELACLHGLRFLAATVLVYGHCLAFTLATSASNAIDFERLAIDEPQMSSLGVHFNAHVETFFAMSALLFGKSLATLDLTPGNFVKTVLKRYLRLIVVLAVSVFYLGHVLVHTDDGPLFAPVAAAEQRACRRHGWLALLMLGNYVNTLEMCHPASWYVPCDFHLQVLALALAWGRQRSPRAAAAVAAAVLVVGALSPPLTTYFYDVPAITAYRYGPGTDIRKNKTFHYQYIQTHNRVIAYAAGLLVGYTMAVYKPRDHKLSSRLVSFLGAALCLCVMAGVLALGRLCFVRGLQGGLLASLFVAVDRPLFAAAVLGLILCCTYGDVPVIGGLLSWRAFAPLGRLSYGVYLLHPLMLYQRAAIRAHVTHHLFHALIQALGLVVVSLAASTAVWLLAEAPLLNITQRYLNTKNTLKET
ncbi:nose resistant to fluoxetine protein 6-like [Leguminivora glycinivorella]|uniref:nose resistant to fluoxetine protein 6-like n=1 Tax=Leguminivora glycinivorella TaxID=1035111 RepID=UPI0020107CA9|nr:nose resistant to fluoxetine protein 6-like [Leguminivora glycinivorella]